MSLSRKRTHDGFQSSSRRDRDEYGGRSGLDDYESSNIPVSKAFDASDDEEEHTGFGRAEEKAVAKPTLRLANLPPATSPAVIKSLIPSSLTVEKVTILPPSAPSGLERKTIVAIVTLSQETAASDIDAAVSALQNRYLGFGFYLSLHRHLSSAAVAAAALPNVTSTSTQHPFGAKPVAQQPSAGPAHHQPGRFAPPPSYGPAGSGPVNRNILHVPVQPLKDVKQLRMIHKVIEGVLEHGPEFEALLMSRPDVQRQEKWAWIWDARSQGGIWYRWRLWEVITGSQAKRGQTKYLPLFEGSHAWKVPDQPLAYEYTTGVDGFISESEYHSSDDEDYDDEPRAEGAKEPDEVFLNPIEKSKIVHLLARLPTTLGKLRKGDIARITAFTLTHASRGADEIIGLIVSNIEKPFAYTSANPDFKQSKGEQDADSRDNTPAQDEKVNVDSSQDTSAAKLVALYVVSDILSCSSTSGIRHAWRFRQLFEAALKNRNIFEGLGLMAERLNWGRLRAEKWKRSVSLVLSLWEGWCVFPNETQESFVNSFENPPSAKKDEKTDDAEVKKAAGGRWKPVEAAATASGAKESAPSRFRPEATGAEEDMDSDGSYDEYTDDEEGDADLLAQYHIDGESLLDIDIVGLAIEEDIPMTDHHPVEESSKAIAVKAIGGLQLSTAPPASAPSRKRMRAADMFADDSDSGGD